MKLRRIVAFALAVMFTFSILASGLVLSADHSGSASTGALFLFL